MRNRLAPRKLLWVEELEQRVVLSVTSTNWSGFAAETSLTSPLAGSVTAVSATWTVPKVLDTVGTAYSSFWVGIDGYSSNSVEQIGTDSDIVNGHVQYYAWYEMYPNPFQKVTTITVSPGDMISASVTATASNKFTLSISDGSQTPFSITITAAGAKRSSAEWIAEAPSNGFGQVLPLANFGATNFSKASATISGVTGAIDNSHWQNTSINMVNRNGTLKTATTPANPFDTTTNGVTTSNFSVAWQSSGVNSGGRGGNGGHHWHSSADLILNDTSFFARPAPAMDVLTPPTTPAFNVIRFNAPSANPPSSAWMANSWFTDDTQAVDEDQENLDLFMPAIENSVAMPSANHVAIQVTTPVRAPAAAEPYVPPPLVSEVILEPNTPAVRELEAPANLTGKVVTKIFWLAGAALFFAQGAFFSKSPEIVQEEKHKRRSGVKL